MPVPISMAVIFAPASTAPEGSVTVPTMLPNPWANENELSPKKTHVSQSHCFLMTALS
jgi:hypothetical protein